MSGRSQPRMKILLTCSLFPVPCSLFQAKRDTNKVLMNLIISLYSMIRKVMIVAAPRSWFPPQKQLRFSVLNIFPTLLN